jgi:hypothetical protein
MEVVGAFAAYWATPWVTQVILTNYDNFLMKSTFQKTLTPYLIMFSIVYAITIIKHLITSFKNCKKSWGVYSAFKMAIFATGFSILGYLIPYYLPQSLKPFSVISTVPLASQIGHGFYLSIGAMCGYYLSHLIINSC